MITNTSNANSNGNGNSQSEAHQSAAGGAGALTKQLQWFIGPGQREAIDRIAKGEEGQHIRVIVAELATRIAAMPKTYDTQYDENPTAHLHYFIGNADWYITERDVNTHQTQAFGWADLGFGFGELGYISIAEIIAMGAEIDLHFLARPLSRCKKPRG